MIRYIALFILISLTAGMRATAQDAKSQLLGEPLDLERIKEEVTDRNSPYYYPRLLEEYQHNDTLMKIDKYRRLYFGMIFQEDYNPYRSSGLTRHLRTQYAKPELTRQECDSVIKYAEMSLRNDPFDFAQMIYLISALRMKGKNNLANIWQYKLNNLLLAIVSSGTGLDEENAWTVIEPQHEYVLINLMGYTVDNHLFYEPYYEYITVKDASGKDAGGYYFNIGALLEEYYRKFPEDT